MFDEIDGIPSSLIDGRDPLFLIATELGTVSFRKGWQVLSGAQHRRFLTRLPSGNPMIIIIVDRGILFILSSLSQQQLAIIGSL